MYWYDGQPIDSEYLKVAINAPEFCYGASIFTTMRVYEENLDHALTHWSAHCDRLKNSLTAFHWQQPDWDRLRKGALCLVTRFPVLRLAIFPQGKELIAGRNLPPDLKQRQDRGVTAWVARENIYRRELAAYKTGNYLGAYLARDRALSLNAQEAILVDSSGNWLETSTGNLWGYKNGCWYTPPLEVGILPGIGRSHLLQSFQDKQLSVTENIWTPDFVASLEGLFYSNCVVGIIPIVKVLNFNPSCNYPKEYNASISIASFIFKTL